MPLSWRVLDRQPVGSLSDCAVEAARDPRRARSGGPSPTPRVTDQICIGIKATFGRGIERLNGAIAELRATGWLDDVDIRLVLGPSSYLFGEETALLEVIEDEARTSNGWSTWPASSRQHTGATLRSRVGACPRRRTRSAVTSAWRTRCSAQER